MSEIIPSTLVENQILARQAAEAEIPFRELSLQARNIGNLALHELHANTSNTVSSLYLDAASTIISENPSKISSELDVKEEIIAPSAEKVYSREYISDLLKSTDFALRAWMTSTTGESVFGVSKGATGFGHYGLDTSTAALLRTVSSLDKTDQLLAQQDVPESIIVKECSEAVFHDLNNRISRMDKDNFVQAKKIISLSHAYAQEQPMALLRYSANHTDKLPFTDAHGRRGNSAKFAMMLPLNDAKDLLASVTADPSLMQTIIDVAAEIALNPSLPYKDTRQPGSNPNVYASEWQQAKPPIDAWRHANKGGSLKIAILNGLLDQDSIETIVEY